MVGDAFDTVIARGDLALRRLLARHLRDEVRACFRARVMPWATGNPLLEGARASSAQRLAHATLLDGLHGPEPVYSGTALGGLLDRYLRDRWQFVVQRKDHLVQYLSRLVLEATAADRTLTVLALGACAYREWLELDWDLGRPAERRRRVDVVCVDQDGAAHHQAAARLERNRLLCRARFVAADLRSLEPVLDGTPQLFDLVYAAGLADLLSDGPLTETLRSAYALLAPGGQLLVTHTDCERAPLEVGEWLLGLSLERRTESTFAAVLRRALRGVAGDPQTRLRHDPGGVTVFATVRTTPDPPVGAASNGG